ncbi:hypothetical protein CR513_03101, partial [Mucuna pruriens]
MLLLQEFNVEIKDKKGAENAVADHLNEFPNEQILRVTHAIPWYADIFNYLVTSLYSVGASKAIKERLESDAKYYIWDYPYLWRLCFDQITRKCISESKIKLILHFCHSTTKGGHYESIRIAWKVLNCGLYWPTIFRDTYQFVSTYK